MQCSKSLTNASYVYMYHSIEETVSSQPSVVCRFRSSSLSDTIHHAPPLNDKLQETPTPQSWIASSSEPRARAPCHARKVEGERTRPNSMAYPNEDIPGQLSTRRSMLPNAYLHLYM